MDNNFRPEDSAAKAAPRVNKEISGSMTAQTRGNDIEYQCMSAILGIYNLPQIAIVILVAACFLLL